MKLGLPSYPGSILVILSCGFVVVVSSFSFDRPFDQGGSIQSPVESTGSVPLDYSSSSVYALVSTSSRPTESWSDTYTERTEESDNLLPTICQRVQKYIYIGRDATGKDYQMDTGHCYHVPVTPTQLLTRTTSGEICDVTSPCDVTRLRTERNHLLGGVEHYDIIESCACRKSRQQCARVPLHQTFFPNSPFEALVDVGACRGGCSKENCDGCFPTEKVTKSIEGPNGDECVEKIEECACTSTCYRASHYQIYYTRRLDPVSNTTIIEQRKFDIGICLGTCSPRPFCLIWEPSSGRCLSTLSTPSRCTATSFGTHIFTTPDGGDKIVMSVGNCVCA